MKFWDTSALVPLVIEEERSRTMLRLMTADMNVTISFVTRVEIASAVARRLRNEPDMLRHASRLVRALEQSWIEVDLDAHVLATARRLAHTHALRAGDAIQLACAVGWHAHDTIQFVTLDHELATAAHSEGFAVLP